MSDNLTIVPLETASPLTLLSGRVTQLSYGDDITSVRVLDQPEFGRVSVNPDGTLAVVMSETDHVGKVAFTAEVTLTNGATKTVTTNLDLVQGGQASGWGLGGFYQLETDDQDNSIVEFGENHRKIHISGSNDALSLGDIAKREGLAPEKITGEWLAQHPEYGGSPELALDETAGMGLWKELASGDENSNWLLFEKGHSYSSTIDLTGVNGESALHPVLISSYGDGGEAIIEGGFRGIKTDISNIVIQDLDLTGEMNILWGKNILIEDIHASNELNLQNMEGLTVRNSTSTDVYREDSKSADGVWNQSQDRISGIFVKNTDGILIENNLFDHAGWEEGYDYDLSEDQPQPPSYYSHNVYIQKDNTDVTFRDNISMRGASFGAQIRPGGFIEDNVFIDNNAGVNFFGGAKDAKTGLPGGNYTLFTGNLVTSAGYKTVSEKEGALSVGVNYSGDLPTLIGNIVTHLADPANAKEQAEKYVAHAALSGTEAYFDDTIVYDWIGQKDIVYAASKAPKNPDQNVDGLDTATLDETTIQNFTAQLLGKDSATIADLADFLRAQADGKPEDVADADLILAFFREGFGLDAQLETVAASQRFIPSDLGDGMRWDNRLNWDQGNLPNEGQDIDLGGNRVYYAGAGTNSIGDLDLGPGGSLVTGAGKLTVSGSLFAGEIGGAIEIGNAGQVWLEGYADRDLLSLDISGGRLANTGAVTGLIDMTVSGGQALLVAGAGQLELIAGSRIRIIGDEGRVGFDGIQGDVAQMRMVDGSILAFTADESGVSTISEFRSGAYGDTVSDSRSSISLDGALTLDISDLGKGVEDLTLIAADEISGDFDEVTVTGLGKRDATLLVDHAADTVTVHLTAGSGKVNHRTTAEGSGDVSGPEPDNGGADTGQESGNQEVTVPPQPDISEPSAGDDSTTVTFSDGRERTTWFSDGTPTANRELDLQNSKNWEKIESDFDSAGDLTRQVRFFDDGRKMVVEFADGLKIRETRTDVDDVRNWSSYSDSFDAGGERIERHMVMDDGSEKLVTYAEGRQVSAVLLDTADLFIWTAKAQSFEGEDQIPGEVRLFDDGRIELRGLADESTPVEVASYEDLSQAQKLFIDQFDFV